MTDFGLGFAITDEDIRIKTLRWHGLLPKYAENRTGNPGIGGLNRKIRDGLVSDSGEIPLNPVSNDTNRNT